MLTARGALARSVKRLNIRAEEDDEADDEGDLTPTSKRSDTPLHDESAAEVELPPVHFEPPARDCVPVVNAVREARAVGMDIESTDCHLTDDANLYAFPASFRRPTPH